MTTSPRLEELRGQLARVDWNQGGALDRAHELRRQIGAELQAMDPPAARAEWQERSHRLPYRRSLYTNTKDDHPALNPSGQPCDCNAGGTGWSGAA